MAGADTRRRNRLRKTKAQLVDELEGLEREVAALKGEGPAAGDGADKTQLSIRAVIENSPTAIFVRDAAGRFLLVNRAYEEWFKVDRDDILGKTPDDVFSPETAEKIAEFHNEVLETGRRIERETMVTLLDGATRSQWVIMFPLEYPAGKAASVCGILTDLSEIKIAQRAIGESEERLRNAIESMQEGFALYDADDRLVMINDIYREINPRAQEFLDRGVRFEELLRANVENGWILDAVGQEEAFIRERMERHRNPTGPILRRHADGRWYIIKETRTRDGGVATTFTDITELKQTEAALRKSEALFRAVVNYSPTKIHIKDVEGRYTLINKEAEKLFGVSNEEGRGKTSYDLFPKDVADKFMAHDRAVIDSGEIIEEEEEWTLDDSVHTFLTVKFPIYDLDGVAAVGAVGTDITARKQAEEALRASEERFRAVIEYSPGLIIIKDPQGRYLIVNKRVCEWYQTTHEDILGKTVYDFMAKESADDITARDRDVIEAGTLSEEERRQIYPDGVTRDVFAQKFPIFGPDGQTVAVGTVINDITERKRAEASARRLARAIEGLSENIALFGPDDRMVICNRMYRELNAPVIETTKPGTPFEDHVRAFVAKGLAPEAKGREEAFIRERMERHRNPTGPFEVARQDGRWYRVHEQKLPDGSTATIASDITDIKQAQEALKESQARLLNILDNSPTPIYFKDIKGRFLVANRQYEKTYNVKFEDIKGKTSKEIFGGELGEMFFDHDQAVLTNRKMIEREENILGRTYLTLKFPIMDLSGELLGLGGIETDVTALKRAERDLRNAKEQAEFANRAKTEFLANMSHELRTPLNSILGFSEVLMSGTLGPVGNPKYQEYAQDIHVSGNHLLSLIGEVLDLSKLEAGEFRIVESEIDVPDAVKSCIRMIEGRATGETAPMKMEFPNGLPQMLGDERRFKQIILNLLGNAVKFTPPEGEIRVAARIADCGRYTIEVADTGVGIAAEDIPKVMEPFGQVRDVFTRNFEGTGLGLYLSKSLTELHGGTLDIASEVGRGTTVTLQFPKERILPCARTKRRGPH